MRSPRPALLLLALLLLPVLPARADGDLTDLFRRAGECAFARGPEARAAAAEIRPLLAALPRGRLGDDDWLDLHVLLAALDRKIDPSPAPRSPEGAEVEAPPESFPPANLIHPGADPASLLDAAAECRRRQPPADAGAVPEEQRPPFAAAARRLLDLARAAAEFESEDLLATVAAGVLAEAARDLAFDLECRSLGRAPCGRDRFAWLLARQHGLAFSPSEVLEIGERAREEILEELAEVAGGRDWRALTEAARESRPTSTEELLAYCEATTREAVELAIASGLVTVPKSARDPWLTLLPAVNPGFPTPFACYRAGGLKDLLFHGTYVVTAVPEDLPEREREAFLRMRDHAWMRVVSLHEAVPGHHLQHAIAAGIENPYRRLGHTSVYVEGWGLYSEDLMDRAGAFPTPPARLALLRMRLWRAVRVIIDVGLHTGGLRPSDAVRMLEEDVLMDRWTAEREVSRYLVSPTQPLSYLIGFEKIRAIRRAYLARHGADAEREFNDRLLSLGPIPLDLAAAVMLGKRRAYDLSHP